MDGIASINDGVKQIHSCSLPLKFGLGNVFIYQRLVVWSQGIDIG